MDTLQRYGQDPQNKERGDEGEDATPSRHVFLRDPEYRKPDANARRPVHITRYIYQSSTQSGDSAPTN